MARESRRYHVSWTRFLCEKWHVVLDMFDSWPNSSRRFLLWTYAAVRFFITPVYCGSLASVRSPQPAYPYRVSGFIAHVKHRLASASRLLTVLAGAISTLSIEVVGDCPFVPPIGFAFQLARENTSRPEPVCLWLQAVFLRRAKRLSESPARNCLWKRRLPLQPCCGLRCRSVHVRYSWMSSSFGFSRNYRSRRTDQIITPRFVCHLSTL